MSSILHRYCCGYHTVHGCTVRVNATLWPRDYEVVLSLPI